MVVIYNINITTMDNVPLVLEWPTAEIWQMGPALPYNSNYKAAPYYFILAALLNL